MPAEGTPNIEAMREKLKEHLALTNERQEIDARQDALAERVAELATPIEPDHIPRLLELVIEQLSAQRKSIAQIDERLDSMITRYMEDAIAAAEAWAAGSKFP